ncbi:MAG: hypothetical protein RLZZ347_243 [Candidatus Parcubacteria bacterium]|jgi:hypothetical protein
MAEAVGSSFDEQFEEFKKQFIASHPTIASCPRALSAHIGAIDAELDRRMTRAGHVVTDEIEALSAGILMLYRFFKEEFGHLSQEI